MEQFKLWTVGTSRMSWSRSRSHRLAAQQYVNDNATRSTALIVQGNRTTVCYAVDPDGNLTEYARIVD